MKGYNTKIRYETKLLLFVSSLALWYNCIGWSFVTSTLALGYMIQKSKIESVRNLYWIIVCSIVSILSFIWLGLELLQAYYFYASTSTTQEEVVDEGTHNDNKNLVVVRWDMEGEVNDNQQQQPHPGTVLLIQRCLASILLVSILSSSLTFSEDKQLESESESEGIVKEKEEAVPVVSPSSTDENKNVIEDNSSSKNKLATQDVSSAFEVVVENNNGNEVAVDEGDEFEKEQAEDVEVESITTCNTTISSRVSLLMQYSEDEAEMEGEGEEMEKTSSTATTEKKEEDDNDNNEGTANAKVKLNKANSSEEEGEKEGEEESKVDAVIENEEEKEIDDEDDWSYNHKKMLKQNREWESEKPPPSIASLGIFYKSGTRMKPTTMSTTSTTTTRPMMSMVEKKAMAMKMMEEW